MQDRTILTPGNPPPSSPLLGGGAPDAAEASAEETPSAPPPTSVVETPSMLDQSLTALRETLDEHKGKLAMSAAATLGLIVYYKWREKQLAEEDPQEYERLQRIKDRVRLADDDETAFDKAPGI